MLAAYYPLVEIPWFIRIGSLLVTLIFVSSVVFIAVRCARRR